MRRQAHEAAARYGTPAVPPCDEEATVALGPHLICQGCADAMRTLAELDPRFKDALEDLDQIAIPFGFFQWAAIAAALRCYLSTEAASAKASFRDGLAILQEIDRVMRGADEPAPPDDLLGDAGA